MPVPIFRRKQFLREGDAFHYATVRMGGPLAPMHTHDFHEVFWVVAGVGEERTPRQTRTLRRSTLRFVRHDEVHRVGHVDEAGVTLRNLAFPRSTWRSLARRYGSPFERHFSQAGEQVTLPPAALDRVDAVAAELLASDRSRFALELFLMQLVHLVGAAATRDAIPAWLDAALESSALIEGGVDALVAASGRSHEHVARTCRARLQRTPTELVNDARVQRAAELLGTTDRSVLDIAYDVGFSNLGHFHACFRARHGTTPLRYRNWQRATVSGG